MKRAIESLCNLPGVDLAMATTEDGVPIVSVRSRGAEAQDVSGGHGSGDTERDDALAALTMGWVNELRLASGLLSWDVPERVVLRCARGSIVLRRMRGAVLMVVMGRSASPEDVRLAMDAAASRIERSLKKPRAWEGDAGPTDGNQALEGLPAPMPGTTDSRLDPGAVETSCNTSRREDQPEH